MKCTAARSSVRCSVARSLEVLRVSYIIALSDWRSKINDAQNVNVDTARGKDNDQQNLLKKNDNVNVILQGIY